MKRSSVIGVMVGVGICLIVFLAFQIQYVYNTLSRQAEMASHAYQNHAVPLLELGDTRSHLQQLMLTGVTDDPMPVLREAGLYWRAYLRNDGSDAAEVGKMQQEVERNLLKLEAMPAGQWRDGTALQLVRETVEQLGDIRRIRAIALQNDFESAEQSVAEAKRNALWMLGGIGMLLCLAMLVVAFNVARFFRQVDKVVSESEAGHIVSVWEGEGAFSEFGHIKSGMLEMQKSLTRLISAVSEDSIMLSNIAEKLPKLAENMRLRSLDSSLLAEDVVSDNTELRLGLAQIEMQLLELEAVLERSSSHLEEKAADFSHLVLKRMDKTVRMLRLMVDERVAEISELNNLVKEERQIGEEMVQLSHMLNDRCAELRRQVAWFRMS
jgi:methyl-accepting chemotaxis protein